MPTIKPKTLIDAKSLAVAKRSIPRTQMQMPSCPKMPGELLKLGCDPMPQDLEVQPQPFDAAETSNAKRPVDTVRPGEGVRSDDAETGDAVVTGDAIVIGIAAEKKEKFKD